MSNSSPIGDIIDRYIQAFVARDKALFLSTFAEDGQQADPAGTPPRKGKAALGEFFDMVAGAFERIEMVRDALYVCGEEAAVVFTLTGHKGADVVTIRGVDIFRVGPDGLIQSLSVYH